MEIYREIVGELNTGVLVLCKKGRICLYLNSMAREILAIDTLAEAQNIDWSRMIPESEVTGLRSISKAILSVTGFSDDVYALRFDGSGAILNLSVRRLDETEDGKIVLLFRDVTEEKKLQRELLTKQEELTQTYQELLNQNRELAQLDKMKDKFIALTTHELRTPASAILSTADLLYQGIYEGEEELREYLKMLLGQGEHLLDIINDILDFSKIQAGKMEFFVEELDVNATTEMIVGTLDALAATSGQKITYQPEGRCLTGYFDALRFKQVLSNVIGNAIKFNREKGQIWVKTESDGTLVKISIRDEGAGIPKDKASKVFNEFETVGNIDTHHKGTGLGMPISKRLMNTMGGDVSFESEVGTGTTFFITVPKEKILAAEMYGSRKRDEAA